LDIREVLGHEKYLGLPTKVGRSKQKLFLFIKNCITRRLAIDEQASLLGWSRSASKSYCSSNPNLYIEYF